VSLKIASWNVEGRLHGYVKAGRGSAAAIVAAIAKLDADIIILPEAYLDTPAAGIDTQLKGMGYEIHDIAYGHEDRDWSLEYMGGMPYLRVLSRVPILSIQKSAWAKARNLLTFTVKDPATNQTALFLATHLDDRSETLRDQQIDDIVPYIKKAELPAVMLGDFNAMWATPRAKVLGSRAVRLIARNLPHMQIRDIATRLTDMATGSVLKRLKVEVGLRDADGKKRPTTTPKMREIPFMPSIRLVQIDHILVSSTIEVENHTVYPDMGSDHRAISAEITIK
jgi:endonuclease/exonuclease/phosphatase family metal-dependent hydrolase